MVSLERTSGRSGGFSFSSHNMDDEERLFQDANVQLETTADSQRNKRLLTYIISVFLIFCTVALEVVCILLLGLHIWGHDAVHICGHPIRVESLVIYIHTLYWACHSLMYLLIKRLHTKVRLQGYLQFDRKTRNSRKAAHYVVLCAKVALLLSVAVDTDAFSKDQHSNTFHWMLLGIISIEAVVNIVVLVIYTVQVFQFNQSTAPPDALDEHYLTSSLNGPLDAGCSEETRLEEVIEKQAELIHYLRDHNSILSRQLLNATSTSHD